MATKIICYFPLSGATYFASNNEDTERYEIIDDSAIDSFKYEKRVRTQEELDEIKEWWDSQPHLMSGEGKVDLIRNEVISACNPNYPDNFISYIDKCIKFDTDFIFISIIRMDLIKRLLEKGEDITFVYPEITAKNEYIGRLCFRDIDKSINRFTIKKFDYEWEHYFGMIESIMKDYLIKSIVLKNNQYISDIIEDIK